MIAKELVAYCCLIIILGAGLSGAMVVLQNKRVLPVKIMAVTEETGVVHPNAVWSVISQSVDNEKQIVNFTFAAWHDLATYKNGDAALLSQLARKSYFFDSAGYEAIVNRAVGNVLPTTSFRDLVGGSLWVVALETKDTPCKDDPKKLCSFFAGASEITK